MVFRNLFFLWFFLSFDRCPLLAQAVADFRQTAHEQASLALKLMDTERKYDEAIALLEQARKTDPKNPAYRYEIAYAFFKQKKYEKTIEQLRKTLRSPQADAQYYRLLGNAYEQIKKDKKAEKIYKRGLKKFPNAGQLYADIGGLSYRIGKNDAAITHWENGIAHDPAFASNYYWAARMYCHSSEKLWGMLYAELFLNLEPNGERHQEMSALLFEVYNKGMIFPTDSSAASIGYSQRARTYLLLDETERDSILPFQVLFDLAAQWAMPPAMRANDLPTLLALRTDFTNRWFAEKYDLHYPNVVFQRQKQIADAGHAEAYHYWLLRGGNKKQFEQWLLYNKIKFDKFIKWFNQTPLKLAKEARFYRLQYAK